ncbi:MAG: TatD family hydrolase [Clostridia bacterium]|nr:TatD family hydrolase [Clostridia bacterium]
MSVDYIDVHCHLNGRDYGNIDALMDALRGADIKKIITSGTTLETSVEAMSYAEKYPEVYFTAGFHPTELSSYSDFAVKEIEKLLSHPKCVAVGEIGLDYHYEDTTDREKEREAFLTQMRMAYDNRLPMVVHSRDAAADTLEILNNYVDFLTYGVLLHCYSYSLEMAAKFAKLPVKFSFGGSSTYHGSKKVRRTIATLDADRLLTETDSPYQSPCSRHGFFPNTPMSIPEICANMAAIRGLTPEDMAVTVWLNAHEFFPKLE